MLSLSLQGNKKKIKMMIISTRDFRTNQTKYLNLAKAGEDIVLRSRTGNFKISPVLQDDDILDKEDDMIHRLRHALQEVKDARQGKIKLQTAEELLNEL